jgi:tetratricopeptide (TPR) repeat protein
MIQTMLLVCALAAQLTACAHGERMPSAAAPRETSAKELLAVAELAERTGDSLRAQQYALAALERGADSRRVLPRLLRLYIADGQYRSAIDTAREGLREHGDDIALRLVLADLYRATELDVLALEQYERVLDVAPTQARAHLELAMLLHEQGDAALRADHHFRSYLSLEPDGPQADEVRARLLKELP